MMDNNNVSDFSGENINKARVFLLLLFYVYTSLAVAIVIAGECGLLLKPYLDFISGGSYVSLTCMELILIGFVPLSLRLFRFKVVKGILASRGVNAFLSLAAIRMSLIGVPVLLNLFFYYQFMEVAFCYMAIIGLLSLLFVYPGKGKCLSEISAANMVNQEN